MVSAAFPIVYNGKTQGDFSVSLEAQHQDEIGELADTFSRMASTLSSIIKDLTRGLNEMATGNFNIAPEVDHIGDFKHIETALVKVIQDLSHTLNEINSVSELVASNAAQSEKLKELIGVFTLIQE